MFAARGKPSERMSRFRIFPQFGIYPRFCGQARGGLKVWFIAYRHSLRPDEAGVKFVLNEAATVLEGQRLVSIGYVVTKCARTSRSRIEAFLAGTLADPEHPLLG
jgi:hypothetical protein